MGLPKAKLATANPREARVGFEVEVLDLVFATGAVGAVGDERARVLERPALNQRQATLQELGLEERKAGRVEPDRSSVGGKRREGASHAARALAELQGLIMGGVRLRAACTRAEHWRKKCGNKPEAH